MSALTRTLGKRQSNRVTGRSVLISCGVPQIEVTPLTARMIRLRLAPDGTFAPRRSWAVTRPDEDFPPVSFQVRDEGATLLLSTEMITVHIGADPCRFSFQDAEERPFCVDHQGFAYQATDSLPQKKKSIHPITPDHASPSPHVACSKRIEPGEHFYGFGERCGQLEKFGRRMTNWTTDPPSGHGPGTDPLYIAVPLLMAVRPSLTYGVFFNTTWRSHFDIGAAERDVWTMEADGGELDYYLVYGPTPVDVTREFAQLLGTMPLPPRWALGYHQSRWGYHSESVVRSLAHEFRARDIPCDAIHLDIDYMHGYRVFTWDAERFPNPRALINDLHQDGFRVVTIIDPGVKVDPDYHVYQDGMQRRMFLTKADGAPYQGYVWPDASVFSDYTRPAVREWWGNLHQSLVDVGVDGIWNDMNEPTSFKQPFSAGVTDWDTIDRDAIQGDEHERTTHREVHNLYGYGMAQACYEGMRRHLQNRRPFVLSRSGFAGSQRWTAFWMGDNTSWWEHLEMALPQLLNMGLSGIPFVGTDIGGFFGNATPELFTRWMQVGILSPLCRAHSSLFTRDQEPWAFGPEVEAICRDYLHLRYRLMPYLYTLFWEASQHGTPILRPLFYHFPNDTATYHIHDQAMLGEFLLAAPVYKPGRTYRSVYLPAGDWYDWWNDTLHHGPTHILAYAPPQRLPLYVRAGTVLPSGPHVHFTDEHPLDPLVLDLYPGNGHFTLYEDDGCSFDYEQGAFCTTAFRLSMATPESSSAAHPRITFEIGARTGHYVPERQRLLIRLHAVDERTTVREGLTMLPYTHYDPLDGTQTPHLVSLSLKDDGSAHTLSFEIAS